MRHFCVIEEMLLDLDTLKILHIECLHVNDTERLFDTVLMVVDKENYNGVVNRILLNYREEYKYLIFLLVCIKVALIKFSFY